MKEHYIYISAIARARSDAADFKPEFKVPKSYTKQDTIDKWLATKEAEFTQNAAWLPYLGEVTKMCVGFSTTGIVHTLEIKEDKSVAKQFAEKFSLAFDSELKSGTLDCIVRPVGFNIKSVMKLIGLACAEESLRLPPSLWYGGDYRDVANILLPDCKELGIGLAIRRLLRSVPITKASKQWASGFEPHKTCIDELALVALLIGRMNVNPSAYACLSSICDAAMQQSKMLELIPVDAKKKKKKKTGEEPAAEAEPGKKKKKKKKKKKETA
jgi:hypothetical protein